MVSPHSQCGLACSCHPTSKAEVKMRNSPVNTRHQSHSEPGKRVSLATMTVARKAITPHWRKQPRHMLHSKNSNSFDRRVRESDWKQPISRVGLSSSSFQGQQDLGQSQDPGLRRR